MLSKVFSLPRLVFIFIVIINIFLIVRNSGFIFEKDIISVFGDQRLYFEASYSWFVNNIYYLSPYTIGYPLVFYLCILISKATSWIEIMPSLISIQAFIIAPLSYYYILKYSKNNNILQILLFIIYFVVFGLFSSFILNKYLFLGLIPLTESFAILFLILAYVSYFNYKASKSKLRYLVAISIFSALLIWFRSIIIILVAPIFLDLLLDRKIKEIFKIIIGMLIMYIPQLAVNLFFQGNILFNGYVWWENLNFIKQSDYKFAIYGFVDNGLFTLKYFIFNLKSLFIHYFPILILSYIIYKNRRNRFEILILGGCILYTVIIISYWWSSADTSIDRFLLPVYFLLVFCLGNIKQIFRINNNEQVHLEKHV